MTLMKSQRGSTWGPVQPAGEPVASDPHHVSLVAAAAESKENRCGGGGAPQRLGHGIQLWGRGISLTEYTENNKNRALVYPTVTPVMPPPLQPDSTPTAACTDGDPTHAGVPSIVSRQKEGV